MADFVMDIANCTESMKEFHHFINNNELDKKLMLHLIQNKIEAFKNYMIGFTNNRIYALVVAPTNLPIYKKMLACCVCMSMCAYSMDHKELLRLYNMFKKISYDCLEEGEVESNKDPNKTYGCSVTELNKEENFIQLENTTKHKAQGFYLYLCKILKERTILFKSILSDVIYLNITMERNGYKRNNKNKWYNDKDFINNMNYDIDLFNEFIKPNNKKSKRKGKRGGKKKRGGRRRNKNK
jgi:hypothetical protein